MIRTDRFCVWIFIIAFATITMSNVVTFTDELLSAFLGLLALLDMTVNGRLKRYKLLWIIAGILFFYVAYSVSIVHYNSFKAIMADYVVQIKSFLPFVVLIVVRPKLRKSDKQILKTIALINVAICTFCLYLYKPGLKSLLVHVQFGGIFIFVSSMVYLYCSIDENGKIPRKELIIAFIMLTLGLGCTRSKYYGNYVLALFMLFIYRPGILRHLNFKHAIVLASVAILVVAVSWSKIQFYFVQGVIGDSEDVTLEAAFARPAMYAGAGLALVDHVPFGTGLASFGTFYSTAPNYSKVYHLYDLDKVHGLSEDMGDFICDAFYPELAQFGFAGIILFIWFWAYVCGILRRGIRKNPLKFRYCYAIGSMMVIFLLIEGIAGTTPVQASGMITMIFLGLICARVPQKKEVTQRATDNSIELSSPITV